MKNKPTRFMILIMIKYARINRVTYLIGGILFVFLGFWAWPFLIIGITLIWLSYLTNGRYKELVNEYSKNTRLL